MAPPDSILADRHDGTMLGCFLTAAASPFAEPRFAYLRARINEHLALAGSRIVLPVSQEWLIEKHHEVVKIVWDDVNRRSSVLGDFFHIGSSALISVLQGPHFPEEVSGLRADTERKLEAQGLTAAPLRAFWDRAPLPTDTIKLDDLIAGMLGLTRACLEPLDEELRTAFVAMPFGEPFAARYEQLYSPLLRALGYRAVRAWGGVAFEDYWDLLFTLIKKCGVLLADLTGANPNVLHEVGLAEGMGKTALLVTEPSETDPPSNLGYHAVVKYDPLDPRWPARSIEEVAVVMRKGLERQQLRLAGNPETT